MILNQCGRLVLVAGGPRTPASVHTKVVRKAWPARGCECVPRAQSWLRPPPGIERPLSDHARGSVRELCDNSHAIGATPQCRRCTRHQRPRAHCAPFGLCGHREMIPLERRPPIAASPLEQRGAAILRLRLRRIHTSSVKGNTVSALPLSHAEVMDSGGLKKRRPQTVPCANFDDSRAPA